jgi:hypothetical protein
MNDLASGEFLAHERNLARIIREAAAGAT